MGIDNAGHDAAVAAALERTALKEPDPAGLLHDRPHSDGGEARPARSVKVRADGSDESEAEEIEGAEESEDATDATEEESTEEEPKPKPEGKSLRQFRRKLREAQEANAGIVKRFAPYAHAEKAAEAGDAELFMRAMAAKGIDVRALLEGKAQKVKDPQADQAETEKPAKAKPEDVAASLESDTRVEAAVSKRLGDHPVLKLDGGLAEVAREVAAGFDPKSGRAPNPKAIADRIVERAKARAKALGLGAEVSEDETDETDETEPKAKPSKRAKAAETRRKPAPAKKDAGPRTMADVHDYALQRALGAMAKAGGK